MLCGARIIILWWVFVASTASVAAPAEDGDNGRLAQHQHLAQQRLNFVAGEQALRQKKATEFQRLLTKLADYPLYPYLLYQELQPRLDSASTAEVYGFLWAYADSPLAWRLHDAWLRTLAEQGRWQEFVDAFQPVKGVGAGSDNSNEVQCLYRRALINTGNSADAFTGLDAVWLTGQSLSTVCDSVFEAWRKDGGLSNELVWQRLELAIEAGQLELALNLSRLLPPEDQLWAGWWRDLRQHPERVKTPPAFNLHHSHLPNILAYGIKRLGLNDAAAAVEIWQALRATQPFTTAHISAVNRSLALALATQNDPQAYAWLGALDPGDEDQRVRERRVLLAMNSGDWSATLTWISQLSIEEQASSRWRYWQARALEQLDFPEQAAALYARLIGRDYYGFLAADRLGQPYGRGALIHRPLRFSVAQMAVIEQLPGIARARELYVLGRLTDTRREWNYTLQDFDETLKLRAAKLAHDWGWRDGAIFTIAQAPRQDDLELLFPLDHREHVELRAKDSAINPAWAFAIMRQESAFVTDARSPVGALGLMQLMPATARMVAKALKVKLKNIDNLLLPEVNVRLGTAYLRTGLDRFAANLVLATAAYNAGVGRVRRWMPAPGKAISAELWVENIPFKETRDYVRRVMAFTVIYQYRLGGEPISLSKLMLPIGEEIARAIVPGSHVETFQTLPKL